MLATHREAYDPNVAARISLGASFSAADYIELGFARARLVDEVAALSAGFDALLYPTCSCVAPTIAEVRLGVVWCRVGACVVVLRVANAGERVLLVISPSHHPVRQNANRSSVSVSSERAP